jgi:Uncharacterised protein family (UPF0261)
MAAVALVGALDTKGPDFAFLAGRLRAAGAQVIVVDAGTGEPDGLTPDIDGDTAAAAAGTTRAELRAAADRGRAVTKMGRGAASVIADLVAHGWVGGVLAAGGSGGSSIAAQVMAALPVGLPKLLVSTMASGDVSPYVGAGWHQRPGPHSHHGRGLEGRPPGDQDVFGGTALTAKPAWADPVVLELCRRHGEADPERLIVALCEELLARCPTDRGPSPLRVLGSCRGSAMSGMSSSTPRPGALGC